MTIGDTSSSSSKTGTTSSNKIKKVIFFKVKITLIFNQKFQNYDDLLVNLTNNMITVLYNYKHSNLPEDYGLVEKIQLPYEIDLDKSKHEITYDEIPDDKSTKSVLT
ncbi:MAG: hypothetical protein AB4060_10050 [Crocosphaera sp.]